MSVLNPAAFTTAMLPIPGAQRAGLLQIGDIAVDCARYRVWRNEREIALGTREFHLLAMLMRKRGCVVSRAEILELVWGNDSNVGDRNVDAYVKRLRRILNAGGKADPIRTIRQVGYAFDEYYTG